MHLNTLDTVSLARLTSSAAHVKGKPPCSVSSRLCLWGNGEELTNIVKESRISGGIASGRSADRRLVDGNDLIKRVKTCNAARLAGVGIGSVQFTL